MDPLQQATLVETLTKLKQALKDTNEEIYDVPSHKKVPSATYVDTALAYTQTLDEETKQAARDALNDLLLVFFVRGMAAKGDLAHPIYKENPADAVRYAAYHALALSAHEAIGPTARDIMIQQFHKQFDEMVRNASQETPAPSQPQALKKKGM